MAVKVIGVVGRLCSGKSYICEQLAAKPGYEWVNCDQLAHRIYDENTDGVLESLVELFGPDAVANGTANRPFIGKIVFEDPAALRALSSLVWPLIRRQVEQRIACSSADVMLLEAAVLFEAGWDDLCELVLYVDVPFAIARERAVTKRHITAEAFERRWAAQQPPPAGKVAAVTTAEAALFLINDRHAS